MLALQVHRTRLLQDSIPDITGHHRFIVGADQLTDSAAACATKLCLLFPRFMVGDNDQDEFGEGHGPRKEFFGSVLTLAQSEWEPVELPELLVDCDKGDTVISHLGSAAQKLEVLGCVGVHPRNG